MSEAKKWYCAYIVVFVFFVVLIASYYIDDDLTKCRQIEVTATVKRQLNDIILKATLDQFSLREQVFISALIDKEKQEKARCLQVDIERAHICFQNIVINQQAERERFNFAASQLSQSSQLQNEQRDIDPIYRQILLTSKLYQPKMNIEFLYARVDSAFTDMVDQYENTAANSLSQQWEIERSVKRQFQQHLAQRLEQDILPKFGQINRVGHWSKHLSNSKICQVDLDIQKGQKKMSLFYQPYTEVTFTSGRTSTSKEYVRLLYIEDQGQRISEDNMGHYLLENLTF